MPPMWLFPIILRAKNRIEKQKNTYKTMNEKPHRLLVGTTLLAISILFGASCTKDSPDYDDGTVTIEGDYREPTSISNGEQISFPAYVSPALPKSFATAVRSRLKAQETSTENASVIFTDTDGYAGLDAIEGRVVIIYHPAPSVLEPLGLDESSPLCVAVQQGESGSCIVREPSEGLEVAESLNGLVAWTNSAIQNTAGNFDESSFWEESSIHTTFSGHMRQEITKVIASKHDYLEGDWSVDVQVKVTPMHGFGVKGSDGTDYYLVTSTLSVASGKMYSGNFTKKHGGVKARICGFYLRSLSSAISMVDASGASVGRFVQVPAPETVIGSTNYTTGWGFSVGGGITGGTSPKLSSTTGFSISSSTSRSISDCDVLNKHHGNTAAYDYTINNLPRYKSVKITDPPLVATSTITFYSQWVWAVPTKDYDVSTRFKVKIDLSNFVYGASYFYSAGNNYNDLKFPVDDCSVSADLPLPNRAPTGKFELTNDVDGTFLTNIKLYNTSHPETGSYHDTSVYGYGNTCSMYLVAGDYDLKCDIKGKDGVTKTREYKGMVRVLTGGNVKLSTDHGF